MKVLGDGRGGRKGLAFRNRVPMTKRGGGGWVTVRKREQNLCSDSRRKSIVQRHPAEVEVGSGAETLLSTAASCFHWVPCGPAVALIRLLHKHAPVCFYLSEEASTLEGQSKYFSL